MFKYVKLKKPQKYTTKNFTDPFWKLFVNQFIF